MRFVQIFNMEILVKKIIGFGLMMTAISSANSQFRFDYTFNSKVGGWLKLHVMPATFNDAFRICNAEGAVLASPLNIQLKNAMVSMQTKMVGLSCGLHTGIHSIFSEGSFASIEGKTISKIDIQWAPDEPDNYNNTESCVIMLQNGTMADVRCTETFPYICYKKKTVNMVINECGTIDNGYTWDARTGKCYKFHRVGRSWRNAHMTCMAEGGHLAIINSKTEVQVLKDIFDQHPTDSILAQSRDVISVGFHDWGESGVWFTIHGQSLEEAGYETFAPGQPDNDKTFDSSGSHCGGMFRNGQLDDLWCTGNTIPFICEKSPDSLTGDDL